MDGTINMKIFFVYCKSNSYFIGNKITKKMGKFFENYLASIVKRWECKRNIYINKI